MDKAEILKQQILKTFSIEEVKEIWAKRLDDDLFVRVGKAAVGRQRYAKSASLQLAWVGWQYLSDSMYFNAKEELENA